MVLDGFGMLFGCFSVAFQGPELRVAAGDLVDALLGLTGLATSRQPDLMRIEAGALGGMLENGAVAPNDTGSQGHWHD